ncbi:MAG: choice-of-anchor L domain-containing protein [Gammaproteobacteria bacterium]|nr:choice-of-anchor L domain-containing protein [Gammaproteobacteria bacterium]
MKSLVRVSGAIAAVLVSSGASAITITANSDANSLASSLVSAANTGVIVTGATLNGHNQVINLADFGGSGTATATSSGTYTNGSGTYGIGPGVVLSTGAVVAIDGYFEPVYGYSDGSNLLEGNTWAYGFSGIAATPDQELLLDPITANPDPSCQPTCNHFDVTELIINFDMQPGFDSVRFNIVFGSEEWPEFADSPFIDGFGMFLNGVNIATVSGLPVNIQHPATKPSIDQFGIPTPGTEIPGTELDGILAPGGNPVLVFGGLVNPTGNTLRFIVADTTDPILDTTVYFSALEGVPEVPLPASIWLLGTAAGGLLGRSFLKRRGARA